MFLGASNRQELKLRIYLPLAFPAICTSGRDNVVRIAAASATVFKNAHLRSLGSSYAHAWNRRKKSDRSTISGVIKPSRLRLSVSHRNFGRMRDALLQCWHPDLFSPYFYALSSLAVPGRPKAWTLSRIPLTDSSQSSDIHPFPPCGSSPISAIDCR